MAADHAWLIRLTGYGLIGNPAGKVQSVVFTDEGLARAEELFEAIFGKKEA